MMPKLNKWHFLLLFVSIAPSAVSAWLLHFPWYAMVVAVWLVIPCRDKQFGNGKKYYWLRQTVFIAGTVLTVMLGMR